MLVEIKKGQRVKYNGHFAIVIAPPITDYDRVRIELYDTGETKEVAIYELEVD